MIVIMMLFLLILFAVAPFYAFRSNEYDDELDELMDRCANNHRFMNMVFSILAIVLVVISVVFLIIGNS
jgi:uncharacterized protein involved in cysteine biosynthesis